MGQAIFQRTVTFIVNNHSRVLEYTWAVLGQIRYNVVNARLPIGRTRAFDTRSGRDGDAKATGKRGSTFQKVSQQRRRSGETDHMTLPHTAMLLAQATGCDFRALLTWANLRQQRARDRFLARRNGKTLQELVHRIVRITAWQMTDLDSRSTRGAG